MQSPCIKKEGNWWTIQPKTLYKPPQKFQKLIIILNRGKSTRTSVLGNLRNKRKVSMMLEHMRHDL